MTEKDLLKKLLSTATFLKDTENETVLMINSFISEKDISELNIYKQLLNPNPDPITFVDLGLSVLWADRNFGANSETDCGDYFSHHDTTHLLDDAFYRMPTVDELEELRDLPNEWVENYKNSGHSGRVFTGKNGKSIFIPAAGILNYHSDTLCGTDSYCNLLSSSSYYNGRYVWQLYFNHNEIYENYYLRYYGCSVRGVCPK